MTPPPFKLTSLAEIVLITLSSASLAVIFVGLFFSVPTELHMLALLLQGISGALLVASKLPIWVGEEPADDAAARTLLANTTPQARIHFRNDRSGH